MNRFTPFLRIVAPIVRPFYGGVGLILMFHRIIPRETKSRIPGHSILEITPQQLEDTLLYFINRGYTAISLSDLHQNLQNKTFKYNRFILYTFDDGYIDNLTYGYPIFIKFNIPFNINIITGFPDRKAVLWWYLLEKLLLEKDHLNFNVNGQTHEFIISTLQSKATAYAYIRKMLKYANPLSFVQLVQSLFINNGIDPYHLTEEMALSWQQIRQLADDPLITISAHTVNHYVLNRLTANEARREMIESKHLLEKHLKKTIEFFAYPYGSHWEAGSREFRLAAECGFKIAMTTRFGNIFPKHREYLMSLPRYDFSRIAQVNQLDLIASGALAMHVNRLRRIVPVY